MRFAMVLGDGAVDLMRPVVAIPDRVLTELRTLVAINVVIVNDSEVEPASRESVGRPARRVPYSGRRVRRPATRASRRPRPVSAGVRI